MPTLNFFFKFSSSFLLYVYSPDESIENNQFLLRFHFPRLNKSSSASSLLWNELYLLGHLSCPSQHWFKLQSPLKMHKQNLQRCTIAWSFTHEKIRFAVWALTFFSYTHQKDFVLSVSGIIQAVGDSFQVHSNSYITPHYC